MAIDSNDPRMQKRSIPEWLRCIGWIVIAFDVMWAVGLPFANFHAGNFAAGLVIIGAFAMWLAPAMLLAFACLIWIGYRNKLQTIKKDWVQLFSFLIGSIAFAAIGLFA
jgi:hypothetical protein